MPDEDALQALREGVVVKGRRTHRAGARLLSGDLAPTPPPRNPPIRYRKSVSTAWLELVLHEGMKRQIRHMTAAVGHPTLRLVRVSVGPLELGDLMPGAWRDLTDEQLRALGIELRRAL